MRQELVDLPAGERYVLRVQPISKKIGDSTFEMLAYNGAIPGPTLRVRQGTQVDVEVRNQTDAATTVHWHGLRLENRFDGVPHETQAPVQPGARYVHRLSFPDAGLFWYHPHVREHFAQEMGLYGNVLVVPDDDRYWPTADRAVILTLDDILLEDGRIAPFDPHGANFAAMGRYGNVLLIGGQPRQALEVAQGEVLRLYLTNTANTRVFDVVAPGAETKLVGGDAGRYEHDTLVDQVVIAPSERAVIDVRYLEAGTFPLHHRTPGKTYVLADVTVTPATVVESGFLVLRGDRDMQEQRRRIGAYLDSPPDKTLAFVAKMDMPEMDMPEMDMPEMDMPEMGTGAAVPADMQHHHLVDDQGPFATDDGIEWEDHMVEANRAMTPANMHWMIVDRDTGKTGSDIDWRLAAGEQVKIRLVNEMRSDHPMHHPFHIHGQRFLVLARDGAVEENLVWKDTVLVRRGEVVDILLDASNPGLWMAHCHIPEHMDSGMMFSFVVARDPAA